MNIIVFSKDRSCQLDLFLRSVQRYWPDTKGIKVLYTYSTDDFKKGYQKLMEQHPDIQYLKESNFKSDMLSLLDKNEKYTVFFVDDIIFKNPFDGNFTLEDDELCVSLRMHPRLNFCYTANIFMNPINKTIWNWRGLPGDYGYPMSVDGHIFRTNDILPLLRSLSYKNPNSLEAILAAYPINRPKMKCFDKSIIVNNPCNKVQTNNPNRHGNISAEMLNQKYLEGYIVDLEPFDGLENESCHKELPVTFINH